MAAELDASHLRDGICSHIRGVVCFLHEFIVERGTLRRSAVPCDHISGYQRSVLSAHCGDRRALDTHNRHCRWHRRGAKGRNGSIALRIPTRSRRLNATFSRGHGDSRLSVPDSQRTKPHSASPGIPRREVSTASNLGIESCAPLGGGARDRHSSAEPMAILPFAKSAGRELTLGWRSIFTNVGYLGV